MDDFNRSFERARKRNSIAMAVILIINTLIFLAVIAGLIWLAVTLYQMGPSGIGAFFGEIADGFNGETT